MRFTTRSLRLRMRHRNVESQEQSSARAPRRTGRLAAALVALGLVALMPAVAAGATNQLATSTKLTAIRVQGNHLVDQNGATVQLRGVDRPSTEYACIQNWAIHSGPLDDTELAAMQNGWHINAVRVPLNESCWLGHGSINPDFSGVNYQNAIRTWVTQITARGMVAILDMHWSEAGSQLAVDQQPMADRASGPAFWTGVANTFKSNPLAVFDLYNEPYPDHENLTADKAWSCWRDGCILPVNVGQNPSPDGATFQAAGMQELINAVRATQATNPVMLGGLDFSGDLSSFLTHLPTDPAKQIVASWHAYPGKARGLDDLASWDQVVAPVAAAVPVVVGEFGRDDCTTTNVKQFLDWMDAHQLSYLAWAWWVTDEVGCKKYDLITDYSTGNPTSEYGKYLQERYLAHTVTQPPGAPQFTFAGIADWDHDGKNDIVTRNDSTGDLYLYRGNNSTGYSPYPPTKIGNGWTGFTFAGIDDWDHDGKNDIVTRNDSTGDLFLYRGNNSTGYSPYPPTKIGNGWTGFTFAGIADWDHDGKNDIVTRNDSTGDLYLYRGNNSTGYSPYPPTKIGNGW